MRLCLDEHDSPRIAVELRGLGYDVNCVKERPELESLSDRELLAVMTTEHRALLTENVGDFMPLIRQTVAAGQSHYGLIFSSAASMPRSRNTIGTFVQRLEAILRARPDEGDCIDVVVWL